MLRAWHVVRILAFNWSLKVNDPQTQTELSVIPVGSIALKTKLVKVLLEIKDIP